MQLSYHKLIAAISMTIVTFISSILPLLIIRRIRRANGTINPERFRIVSWLSCFGGGVFIATCLLHLFPEVSEEIDLICKTVNYDTEFPIAEFLLCIGFLIVLILEQIVLSFKEPSALQNEFINDPNVPENRPILNVLSEGTYSHDVAFLDSNSTSIVDENERSVLENRPILVKQPHNTVQSYGTIDSSYQDIETHSRTNDVAFVDPNSFSTIRSLLLLFAISLHSIFEGLAIGLQSSFENVVKILLAVLLHKCIIAFTLGLKLANSNRNQCNTLKELIFFAFTSPLGIITGVVVMDFVVGLKMMIASATLQGVAAGTFLYVTFFEILPDELNGTMDRMPKMMFLLLGFSTVSLLELYLPS